MSRPNHETVGWRFEGSNDGVGWIALRDEYNYTIGSVAEQIDVDTESYFQYYRLFIYRRRSLFMQHST